MEDKGFYNLLLALVIINLMFSILNLNIFYILLSLLLVLIIVLFNFKFNVIVNLNKVLIILFLILCIIGSSKTFTKQLNEDFINKNYNEVYMYAKDNNYKLNTNYEYSDKMKENKIIAYSKTNDKINVVISNGPDYAKKVVVPNLENKKSKVVSDFIKNNYLNNVKIKFENIDGCERNTLFSQSIIGTMNRNEEIIFKFCKGKSYKKIYNLNLINMNRFEAIIYLMSNNYTYEEKYQFSNIINKNNVIKTNEHLKENKITLYVSKGKIIFVPKLSNMNKKQIYNWIIKNNLNVVFKYVYSEKIQKGRYIKANVKEGSKVSEIDDIVIYFSKGDLVLPNFSKLNEFKDFASTNNIDYKIKGLESTKVKEGDIIKFSINPGAKIDSSKRIIVYVAKEKQILEDENKEEEKDVKKEKEKHIKKDSNIYNKNSILDALSD